MSDAIGRKPVIMLADLMFALGSIMMYFAQSVNVLMIGRIVVGLGVGLASLIVPIYLSEISPTEVRGTVVAVNICLVTSGQFIASCISYFLGSNWRLMLGIGAVPATI